MVNKSTPLGNSQDLIIENRLFFEELRLATISLYVSDKYAINSQFASFYKNMIKRIIFILLILPGSALVSHAQIASKRRAPKEVTPVVVKNVKYTAPTDQIGYVVAKDAASDTVIWKKKIYTIRYNDHLEKDVQDVFIDTLYIKSKNLMIHTERGKIYSLAIEK